MEQKSEPKRALIFILSALLGGMLSILLVLIRHYVIKQKIA
jgi:LPS O-antigen subunit length determinant protein (WzzB/FepE family)